MIEEAQEVSSIFIKTLEFMQDKKYNIINKKNKR